MLSLHYAHLPPDLATVHIALFRNVTNSAQIRSRIVRASQLDGPDGETEREAVNFAFVDARLVCAHSHSVISVHVILTQCASEQICSVLHLQTAVYQAILAQVQNSIRTKTVHSEILWALNPTNNVTLHHRPPCTATHAPGSDIGGYSSIWCRRHHILPHRRPDLLPDSR